VRNLTARQRGNDGWHYVSLGSTGGYPIGYCADHEPHPTEAEARECYAKWRRDHVGLDIRYADWTGCAICDAPTKKAAGVQYDYATAALCDEHLTHENAVTALHLDAGDSWMS
jgi:hypothetical protein